MNSKVILSTFAATVIGVAAMAASTTIATAGSTSTYGSGGSGYSSGGYTPPPRQYHLKCHNKRVRVKVWSSYYGYYVWKTKWRKVCRKVYY